MTLARPQIVLLDSGTIGKISKDYWSTNKSQHQKARELIHQFRDKGAFLALTMTHVFELLRHGETSVARDRIAFLRQIPLIAWLRPYNRTWFPGGLPDVLLRELHIVVHQSMTRWPEIIRSVRTEVWETGHGSDMFTDDERFWSAIRKEAMRQHESEKLVASIARTKPGHIGHLKIKEIKKLPIRSKRERTNYARTFVADLKNQLANHGDPRLENTGEIATGFAYDTFERIRRFEEEGTDSIQGILEDGNIPPELISDDMTVDEVGQLGIYIKQLSMLCEGLRPIANVSALDVPPNTLPSYVLERELANVQQKARRVSGSDLGDAHVAPLTLYADIVEVDKRTHEYLTQVKRKCTGIGTHMGRFFRTTEYEKIDTILDGLSTENLL